MSACVWLAVLCGSVVLAAQLAVWGITLSQAQIRPEMVVWAGVGCAVFSVVAIFAVVLLWELRRSSGEQEIRDSESHFRLLSDLVPIPVWLTDADLAVRFVSRAWLAFSGRSAEQELGTGWMDGVHPEDREHVALEFARAKESRQDFCIEHRMRRADGEYRWVFSRAAALFDPDSTFRGFVGACVDITDQKEDEARQNLLMRELDHRVKNSLAAVLAVADSTFATTTTREQFRGAFTGRLMAMAHTHTALAKGRWSGLEIAELCATVLEPLSPKAAARMSYDGDSVMVPPEAVPPLGMVLHELATNALKYGALSSPAGTVAVRWGRRDGAADGPRVEFTWDERGGPPLTLPITPGLGTILIQGLIQSELGGDIALVPETDGFRARFSFPLDAKARGWKEPRMASEAPLETQKA